MNDISARLAAAPVECMAHPSNYPRCVCGGTLHRVASTAGGRHTHWRHNPGGDHCENPRPSVDCSCVICTATEMITEITDHLVRSGQLEGNAQAVSDLLTSAHALTDRVVAEAVFWQA